MQDSGRGFQILNVDLAWRLVEIAEGPTSAYTQNFCNCGGKTQKHYCIKSVLFLQYFTMHHNITDWGGGSRVPVYVQVM